MFAGNATATDAITAVNLTKAALVSYYMHLAITTSWSDYAVAGWFSAGNQLSWQRHFSASNVDGHYYVFEAKNAEFSVQAVSFTVAAGSPERHRRDRSRGHGQDVRRRVLPHRPGR